MKKLWIHYRTCTAEWTYISPGLLLPALIHYRTCTAEWTYLSPGLLLPALIHYRTCTAEWTYLSPGLLRPALIWSIVIGCFNKQLRADAFLKIWPPWRPSIRTVSDALCIDVRHGANTGRVQLDQISVVITHLESLYFQKYSIGVGGPICSTSRSNTSPHG